jgi:hypothetical protein
MFTKKKEKELDFNERLVKTLYEVYKERYHQIDLSLGGDTNDFDKSNTKNDWIAYINAYIGRAAAKVERNEREGCEFRKNMVKAAALAVAAIEAYDKGWIR